MKWKLLSIFTVLLITLMACQAGDNADRGTDNPNIDPTSTGNTGDANGMIDDRNHTLQRDADRYQNRTNNNRANRDNSMERMNQRDNTSNYEVAEEAADKITEKVKGIDRAFVITTDNNAYVAANLDNDNGGKNGESNKGNNRNQSGNNGDDLTDEVKDEIAKIVQSVDDDIDNVYVSTNPDFLNLANDYADDVDNGEPIEGFFDQFGTMIDRLFPENRR